MQSFSGFRGSYSIQNVDSGISERSRGASEAFVASADKGVASEKSYNSLKIWKNREKNLNFSDFHPFRIDSEFQFSIDLWPCTGSKTSILASLSALEELVRPAFQVLTRGWLLKKVMTHWKSAFQQHHKKRLIGMNVLKYKKNRGIKLNSETLCKIIASSI